MNIFFGVWPKVLPNLGKKLTLVKNENDRDKAILGTLGFSCENILILKKEVVIAADFFMPIF